MKESPSLKKHDQINSIAQGISQRAHRFIIGKKIKIKDISLEEISRRVRQVFFSYYFEIDREVNLALKDSKFNWDCMKIYLDQNLKVKFKKSNKFAIKVSFLFFITKFFQFFYKPWALLVYTFFSIGKGKKKRGITWVLSPSLEGSLNPKKISAQFLEYCQKGPHPFLRNADLIICEHISLDRAQTPKLILTPNAYREICRHSSFSLNDWINLVRESLEIMVFFSIQVFKNPFLILLGNDIKDFPFVKLLNKKAILDNVVINTSFMYHQKPWFHCLENQKFQTHFIWYGTSTTKIKLKGTPSVERPSLSLFYAQNNYFWNEFHKEKAKCALGFVGNMPYCSTSLFYLPKIKKEKRSNKRIFFCLEAPAPKEKIHKYFLEDIYFCNNYKAFERYVFDFGKCLKQIEKGVEVIVKPKKNMKFYLNSSYAPLIEEMKKWNVSFFPKGDDLFNGIANSDLLLCLATSSPAFIGVELKVPTLYYDPEQNIDPRPYRDTGILWCDSPDNLLQTIKKVLD